MIIRGAPKDIDNYIAVSSVTSLVLHTNGFNPRYIDDNYIYYRKSNYLVDYMNKEGLFIERID